MRRSLRRTVLLVALAIGSAVSAGSAPASAQTSAPAAATASAFLDAKLKTVRALLSQPASPEREKKLDAELGTLVDYDDMAKVALGEEWGKRSKEEIAEFTGLLRQLIEKNYKKRLQDTLKYDIANKGEEPKGAD
ncbi:MAG: ABC transporter substrate-binding protein, partial [Deltaproteobacteria bacterium]|nr:ABC transporter substrate-binding protein [Deltaproteobacteria bacterium]